MVPTSAVLALSLAACGSTETSEQTETDTTSPTSEIEGTVSFYTSQPETDATALVEEFNKLYPDVKVNTFRSGTEEVVGKILAENEAKDVQADVLLVADEVTFENLKSQDLLEAYESPELKNIPEQYVDEDKMYVGTKIMATVLAYNTDLVEEAPTSWADLTDAKTKDLTIMPSPLYSGAAAYNLGIFTRTDGLGWDFYENLKSNGVTVGQGNGTALQGIQSGDQAYAIIVDYLVTNAKKDGSPIELVYPQEGVPVITEPIALMKDAEDPEAAQAFIDFVLSKEGQELAASLGYAPIRTDVEAPNGLKSVSELNVLSADVSELFTNRETDKEQFKTMFGE
ncbi:extracellular solute-binding protein [Lysinibacillus telephonicus]|uniref:Extracellular solute-binding protein n=2 Tax=Lysinibacillus telephonicus TaxID=1714840 RepID=A0A431UQJ9_9BACI|nr:extracellular solute-binding protein [Lysinibacillus telephonicus]